MKKVYDEYIKIEKGKKITEKVLYTRITSSIVFIVFCMIAMTFAAYSYYSADVVSANNYIESGVFDVEVVAINEVTTVSYEKAASNEGVSLASELSEEGEGSSEENTTVEVRTIERTTLDISKTSNDYYFTLLKAGTNFITVSYEGNTDTGFCAISFDGVDETYHTQQLGIDKNAPQYIRDSVSFTVNLNADTLVYILPHWGTSSDYAEYSATGNNSDLYIISGDTLSFTLATQDEEESSSAEDESSKAQDETPVDGESEIPDDSENASQEETEPDVSIPDEIIIDKNDNLYSIAEEYNTTVEKLTAYNDIDDPNLIQYGQTLKIPPADWEIPDDYYAEEPVDDSTEEPVDDSTEEPIDDSTEEPIDDSTEEPVDDSTEEPVDDSTEEPVDDSTEEPVDDSTEEPVDDSTEEPIDDSTEEPVDDSADEPVDDSTEEPVDDSTEEPVDDSTEEPVDDSTEEPVDDSTEEPVEESTEEPVEESTETTDEIITE